MSSTPSTPNSARATAASASKRSPMPSNRYGYSKNIKVYFPWSRSSYIPRKLTIKPAKLQKPHSLTTIPAEIRLMIYDHVLLKGPIYLDPHRFVLLNNKQTVLTPSLLRVCRLIRTESTEFFYTKTPFVSSISALQSKINSGWIYKSMITTWIDKLQPWHFTFFARNHNMTLVIPSTRTNYLRSQVMARSRVIKRFGDLCSINEQEHQFQFVRFCRVALWWLSCAEYYVKMIKWRFEFEEPSAMVAFNKKDRESQLEVFLYSGLATITFPKVQKCQPDQIINT